MIAPHASKIIDGYIARLEAATGDVPRAQRQEVIESVREHIAEARAGLTSETDSDVLNILDRLGDPSEIAAEERERLGLPRVAPGPSWIEIGALILTPLFWPVGVILLSISGAWNTRDKLIGALVLPGGLVGSLFIFGYLVAAPRCSTFSGHGHTVSNCPPVWEGVMLLVGAVLILLLPVFSSIYLGIRLRRRWTEVARMSTHEAST